MSLTREEFRSLFDEERDALYRFLHRVAGNQADAEDLLQETFVLVWRKRGRYEARENAAGYLRTIAFRLYLSRSRRAARRRLLAPPRAPPPVATPPDDQVALDEERRLVRARVCRAMDRLPVALREAFDLYRVQGLSVREIAEWTGAPVKTVETRIRRATLWLASVLDAPVHERCTNHD